MRIKHGAALWRLQAMAGPMVEVDASGPEELARERVELRTRRAIRKDSARDRDMALEHAGETLAHFGRRRAYRDRAGDVGGAVLVLRTGVDQEQLARQNPSVGRARDAVMHDRAVRAGA